MNLKQIDSPTLTPYIPKLATLGIDTLEHLQGVAAAAAPELSAFLGTNVVALVNALPVMAGGVSQAALGQTAVAHYQLGVDLDRVPAMSVAPFRFAFSPAAAEALPTKVSHVEKLPPVKDQAERFSCVAFATLAAYEFELKKTGAYVSLSEQFQYWNCKHNDGIPNSRGTYLGISYPLLKRDGVCTAETWPHNPHQIDGDEGQGPPPAGAQLEALSHRPATVTQLAPTDVFELKAALAHDHCVSFSIPVFNTMLIKAVADRGDMVMPVPGEGRLGGHAMCLVGYIDDAQVVGGGRFIVRNSWRDWGTDSPHGPGYGTIPYAYIASHCVEAWYLA